MANIGTIDQTGAIFIYREGQEVKGKWVVGGETHDVTVCKTKNRFFDFFRYFNMSAIYIRTKTHTFKIDKDKKDLTTNHAALKALKKSPITIQVESEQKASLQTLDVVKKFEEAQDDDQLVSLGSNTFAAYRREKGIIQTVSFSTQEGFPEQFRDLAFAAVENPGKVQYQESSDHQSLYFCTYKEGEPLTIQTQPLSIVVDAKSQEIAQALRVNKPLYSNMIQKALSEGKASVLFVHNGNLVRLNVIKTDTEIQISHSDPTISPEQLAQAQYTEQQAEQINETIPRVFASMQRSNTSTLQASINEHDYVLLHRKTDGTVTLGVRRYLNQGTFKKIYGVYRFNINTKKFALAIAKDPMEDSVMLSQINDMILVKDTPGVVPLSKITDKTIKTLGQKVSSEQLFGFQMPLYPGDTAEQLTKNTTSSSLSERMQIASDIAEGLRKLHEYVDDDSTPCAVMDVKPANILIYRDEQNTPHAVLSDIALVPEGADSAISTLVYKPPEGQLFTNKRKASQKYDIWAFGKTLFELTYPGMIDTFFSDECFDSKEKFLEGHQLLLAFLIGKDKDPQYIEINKIIRQALAIDPRDRPPMDVIFHQLQQCQQKIT